MLSRCYSLRLFLARILLLDVLVALCTVSASPARPIPKSSISVKRPERSQLVARDGASIWNFDVHGYTALGDSFSAGPSAGEQRNVDPGDYACSRYDHAFPVQLNNDPRLSPSEPNRNFQFSACSGALMQDVLKYQLPKLDASSNMITLTIGGNDLAFADILNSCVYGFKRSFWIWSCQRLLDWAADKVQSAKYKDDYDSVIGNITTQNPRAHIYVLGYPRFFEAHTSQCSNTCFAPWSTICPSEYILTEDRRQQMNDLVESLNNEITAAVIRASNRFALHGRIQYVDIDGGFEGHRFCEEGTTEPDYNNKNIWFYPFTYIKRDWLQINEADCDSLDSNPHQPYLGDLGKLIRCGLAEMTKNETIRKNLDAMAHSQPPHAMNPGNLAMFQRIFHPTIAGMGSTSDVVVEQYQDVGVAVLKPPPGVPTSTTSSYSPPPTPTPHDECRLGNLEQVQSYALQSGIEYLGGLSGDTICLQPKACSRVSCSYGTGIKVCNTSNFFMCTYSPAVHSQIKAAMERCNINQNCDASPDSGMNCILNGGSNCCNLNVDAFRTFLSDYSILVEGGFDC